MTGAFRPRHFAGLAWLVFAVSILKGIRMPNLWSVTHLTFNYSHGFVRRGLAGELLHLLGGPGLSTYNELALCAVALFVAMACAVAMLVRRVCTADPGDPGLQAAVLVFAASPGIVVLTHLVGYLDDVGLLLVVATVLVTVQSGPRSRIVLLTIVVGVVLALVHESLVLMFVPTLLFALICRIALESRDRPPGPPALRASPRWLAAQVALALVVPFGASAAVSLLGTRSPARIQALQASIARTANFPLRGDAFETLYRPLRDNLFTVMPEFWSNPENQTYLVLGLIAALPGVAFLLGYGVVLIGRLDLTPRMHALLTVAFALATLGPVSLNLVGWDSARWNAISLVDCFCCIAILRLTFARGHDARMEAVAAPTPTTLRVDSPRLLTLAAAAIVLGLCGTSYDRFLFDGYVTQWFPFQGPANSLLDLLRGHFTFIPRS